MNPMSAIEQWLKRVLVDYYPELNFYMGHWEVNSDFDSSRYVSYQSVGGRSPRGDNVRTSSVLVTVVGEKVNYNKSAERNIILEMTDKIMAATGQAPASCGIVSVAALGDIIGPVETEGGRPVVGVTLEVIF